MFELIDFQWKGRHFVFSSFGVCVSARVSFFVIQMLDGMGLGMMNIFLLKLEKATDG